MIAKKPTKESHFWTEIKSKFSFCSITETALNIDPTVENTLKMSLSLKISITRLAHTTLNHLSTDSQR